MSETSFVTHVPDSRIQIIGTIEAEYGRLWTTERSLFYFKARSAAEEYIDLIAQDISTARNRNSSPRSFSVQ